MTFLHQLGIDLKKLAGLELSLGRPFTPALFPSC
jgi:hypothetical protein